MTSEESITLLFEYEFYNSRWAGFMFCDRLRNFAKWYYLKKVARKVAKYHRTKRLIDTMLRESKKI